MKRLVSTRNLSKEDWLRYRKCGITGTDAGAILGLNPYRSAFQVYHDKISDTIENIDNEAMRQGRDLEDYVAQRFSEETGFKVRRANAIYQSEEHPLLLADFDRLIVGQKAGLECKTVSPFSADKWADGKIRLDTLHGYYTAQEQAEISQRQQTFNNIMTVLGVIGDVVQLAITGTTGLGTLAGSLMNTGYNIYAGNRAYEAERADTQWSQQMQEKQRQDALTQQQYDNTASERAYQDALKQQAFNNNVTTQKLNIAKGEWALKQANAQQKAAQAASKAAAARTKSGSSSSGKATGGSGSASGGSRSAVSAGVPYTAALLRSQGKNDVAITSALRQEGYTPAQIAKIIQEMNK